MDESKNITGMFDKCAVYSVMSILVANTINSMARFRDVPKDEVMIKIYSAIKSKAASSYK